MKKMKLLIGALVFAGLPVAYGESQTVKNQKPLMQKAKAAAYDFLDKDTVSIEFDKNSSVVTESMKTSIHALLDAIMKDGKVEKVYVASWADRSLPADSSDKLSDGDKTLAKDRAENVKMILDARGINDVKIFNMAEQPSWLGKTFKSNDAEVKETMKGQHVGDQDMRALGKKLEDHGGLSQVVIAVARKSTAKNM